jgi:hypothetical protein
MGESSDFTTEDFLTIFVVVVLALAFLKLGCDMMFPKKMKRQYRRRVNERYENFDAAIPEQAKPVGGNKLPVSKPNPPGGGVVDTTVPSDMEFNKASQEKITKDVSTAQAAMKDESAGVSSQRILGVDMFGQGGPMVSYTACDNTQGPLLDQPLVPNDAVIDVRTRKIDYSMVSPNSDCTSLNYQPCGVDPRTGKQFLTCPPASKKILPPVNQQINVLANKPSGAALKSMDQSSVVKSPKSDLNAEVTLHWAEWCPHSRNAATQWDPSLMKKQGEGLSSKLDGQTVAGVQVKTDSKHFDTPESKQEKIQAFPTYVVKVFKQNGEQVARYTYNAINAMDVQNQLQNLLSNLTN